MSGTIVCPACQAEYPYGTLMCEIDGTEFFELEDETDEVDRVPVQLPVLADKRPRLIVSLIDHVKHRDWLSAPTFVLREDALDERPLIIGRADTVKRRSPLPDIDLTPLFAGYASRRESPPMSRVQASIYRRSGKVNLRAGDGSQTWIRRWDKAEGKHSRTMTRLLRDRWAELQPLDEIAFGNPRHDHVRLVVVF